MGIWSIVLVVALLLGWKKLAPLLTGGAIGGNAEQITAAWHDSLRALATRLGCTATVVEKPADPKVWQGGGMILQGTYQGVPLELRFLHETRDASSGLTTAYTYKIDHRVTVGLPQAKRFAIAPREAALATTPTGVAAFDTALQLTGDAGGVSHAHLEALAAYGWMHLEATAAGLALVDNFTEYNQQTKGSMSMLSAVHPIWKTSARNPRLDLDSAVAFVDLLLAIARANAQ